MPHFQRDIRQNVQYQHMTTTVTYSAWNMLGFTGLDPSRSSFHCVCPNHTVRIPFDSQVVLGVANVHVDAVLLSKDTSEYAGVAVLKWPQRHKSWEAWLFSCRGFAFLPAAVLDAVACRSLRCWRYFQRTRSSHLDIITQRWQLESHFSNAAFKNSHHAAHTVLWLILDKSHSLKLF